MVVSGDAARWNSIPRVLVLGREGGSEAVPHSVESARSYRDRLVLKLRGIDDASAASALRGCTIAVLPEDLPKLPDDVYWSERLVGMRVDDARLGLVGRVVDVIETGGVDLLEVRDAAGRETLIPLAGAYVDSVDDASATIHVTIPSDLRDLNDGRDTETP